MYNISVGWGEEGINIRSDISSVRKLEAVSYTKLNVRYSQL